MVFNVEIFMQVSESPKLAGEDFAKEVINLLSYFLEARANSIAPQDTNVTFTRQKGDVCGA